VALISALYSMQLSLFRHDRCRQSALELHASMERFHREIAEEVKAVLDRTQYVIKGEKKV